MNLGFSNPIQVTSKCGTVSDTCLIFLKCDRELNSQQAALNATLTSLWTDTCHTSALLTKTEARTGVTVMTINMEDGRPHLNM